MEIVQNKKNNALLVSFYFPPGNTIAAVRIGKFAKYLPEFGWEPKVLTVDNVFGLAKTLPVEIDESKITRTSYYSVFELVSRRIHNTRSDGTKTASKKNMALTGSLVLKISHLCEPIFRLPVIEKLLFDPMGWYRPAVKAGLEIIKSNDIKVILSSYGPSVPHFIAARLHRETGIPWVADYRDDWIDEYRKHPQPLHYFDQQWEKHTVRNCSAIVAHTYPLARILENSHGKVPTVIPNGFDKTDYEDIIPLTDKFTITYTGFIYPGKRDSSSLFQALAEAKQEGTITPQDMEMRFYGTNVNEQIPPLTQKYHLEDFVITGGYIPYKDSIKKQMESTILLIVSWNNPLDVGTLSGKTYEYLGAGRPILAIAYPGGEIDKLLRKSGCGIVLNDPGEIKQQLLSWLEEFKRTGAIRQHYHPDPKVISTYTRREQAGALAAVFNTVSY